MSAAMNSLEKRKSLLLVSFVADLAATSTTISPLDVGTSAWQCLDLDCGVLDPGILVLVSHQ